MNHRIRFVSLVVSFTLAAAAAQLAARQLAPCPTEQWIKQLENPRRVERLQIDYIITKLELKPGQVVADIGAGPGVISLPMAKAVAPSGKVYAVEIDQPFLDHIATRAAEQNVTNITPVLGKFADPSLPARDVDVALFHDVLHHIEDRAGYLKAMARYMKPTAHMAVIENATHRNDAALFITKDQTKAWMADAGFAPVQEFDGLSAGTWFVVYAR